MSRRTCSLLSWTWVLLAAVTLALLMRTFLIAAFYIPSESMEPVLEIGDRLLVSKLSYRIGDPEPGDVVVFRTPPSMQPAQTAELIKRVVAVGGQQVEAVNGRLIIDGSPVDEHYLSTEVYTRDFGPVLVPAGYVFVMGDNRRSSQDSRVFGAIPENEIVGRAFARFWPPTRLGGL
ncbi:MAG: signal peptidase I [Acidimicrobiales bacterium]|nr:signal peptidase I [Acidimicrobiales bacterium]MYG88558.1 signal peptidase I [Acidimicrobiales bacterium]MYI27633.1 signal peptidase I [Acidimicrobiales bacterium]